MVRFIHTALSLALFAMSTTGCSNSPPANNLATGAEIANVINATDNVANQTANPGSNAVAGDVAEGQEVMFTGVGLAVGTIQLHPGQHYEFGRPKWEILSMLGNVRGDQTGEGAVPDCAGRPADYADFSNLRVYFQNDQFVGWDAAPGNPQVRDEWSFSIGMPRDDITDMGESNLRVFRSRRGVEFEADGVRGLLSSNQPDGVVIDLWAGETCRVR